MWLCFRPFKGTHVSIAGSARVVLALRNKPHLTTTSTRVSPPEFLLTRNVHRQLSLSKFVPHLLNMFLDTADVAVVCCQLCHMTLLMMTEESLMDENAKSEDKKKMDRE